MSEKTKHVLSVAVFVAIVLVMAAITFADGPDGWGRLPFRFRADLALPFTDAATLFPLERGLKEGGFHGHAAGRFRPLPALCSSGRRIEFDL